MYYAIGKKWKGEIRRITKNNFERIDSIIQETFAFQLSAEFVGLVLCMPWQY